MILIVLMIFRSGEDQDYEHEQEQDAAAVLLLGAPNRYARPMYAPVRVSIFIVSPS
jgi:hypothetical protein